MCYSEEDFEDYLGTASACFTACWRNTCSVIREHMLLLTETSLCFTTSASNRKHFHPHNDSLEDRQYVKGLPVLRGMHIAQHHLNQDVMVRRDGWNVTTSNFSSVSVKLLPCSCWLRLSSCDWHLESKHKTPHRHLRSSLMKTIHSLMLQTLPAVESSLNSVSLEKWSLISSDWLTPVLGSHHPGWFRSGVFNLDCPGLNPPDQRNATIPVCKGHYPACCRCFSSAAHLVWFDRCETRCNSTMKSGVMEHVSK